MKISQFDKEMKTKCSLKVKWGDSSINLKFSSLFQVLVLCTLFHCFSCLKICCNSPLEKSKGEKNY
jgi:hypothetical protein